jgi:hypothetical protein
LSAYNDVSDIAAVTTEGWRNCGYPIKIVFTGHSHDPFAITPFVLTDYGKPLRPSRTDNKEYSIRGFVLLAERP